MTIKKLLAGAAAAALLTSPAMAFDVTLGDANGDAVGTEIVDFVAVAEEAVFDVPARQGVFEFIISTDEGATFAEDENYIIQVELIGGTFSRNVVGSDLTDGDTAVVTGQSIRFNGGDRTGETGERTVGFLSSIDVEGDNIGLELPIQLDGCNDLDIVVTIQTGGGAAAEPLEQGTFRLDDVVTCVNAFKAVVRDDRFFEVGTSYDSFLTSASEFQRFREGVATAFGGDDDDTDRATLGVASVNFNPTNTDRPILTDLRDFDDALDGSEADDLNFDVVLENGAGIASASVTDQVNGDGTGSSDPFAGLVASLEVEDIDASQPLIADPNFAAALVEVTLTGMATDVENQTPTATNVVLTFDAGEGLRARDNDEMGMDLDDINFEGVRCGEFDWVGDANSPVQNMFRANGYGNDVIEVLVTARNRTNPTGSAASGTITGLDFSGEDVVITSAQIGAALGDFGRADITFNFIGGEGSRTDDFGSLRAPRDTDGPNLSVGGLDCDRLMMTGPDDHVASFGNASTPQNLSVEGFVNDGDDNVNAPDSPIVVVPTGPSSTF